METLNSPSILFWLSLALLLMGGLVFTWGRSLPGRGSWLIWGGLIFLLGGAGFEAGIFLQESFKIKLWHAGWILNRGDALAITVGVLQDLLAYVVLTFSVLMGAALLLKYALTGRNAKAEPSDRVFAGFGIAVAGLSLSCISLTPWLIFPGMLLTVLGAVVALGALSGKNPEAKVVTEFLWERSAGFLVAFFGACILVATGHSLLLNEMEPWVDPGGVHDILGISPTMIGSILLCGGLFLQLQPLPYLGWLTLPSQANLSKRILFLQIFPGLSAFLLLLRLQHQLNDLGVLRYAGWLACGLVTLSLLSAAFQRDWELALKSWVSSGFALSLALLAFVGKHAGLATFIGISLSALSQSSVLATLGQRTAETSSVKKKENWARFVLFLSAAAGTGFFCFVTAGGLPVWTALCVELPGTLVPVLILQFLFVFVGWRFSWKSLRLNGSEGTNWTVIATSLFWILLSLSAFWTGTVSGGFVPDGMDRVLPSLFGALFGAHPDLVDLPQYASFLGFYFGYLLLGIAASFWMFGQKDDRHEMLARKFPKVMRFFAGGYGVNHGFRKFRLGLSWLGEKIEFLVSEKIWKAWLPRFSRTLLVGTSYELDQVDRAISNSIIETLRVLIAVPSKTLQLVQTGDVRWYLFLSLGVGLSLIVHYFKL